MRKLLFLLPIAALFVFVDPLQAFGNTTSTMQVSFTVQDRCMVSESGTAAPSVSCSQADDFIVTGAQPAPAKAPSKRPATPASESSEEGWVVYF